MKILITGAAGFIWYHLVKNLLKKNFTVYGIDNINSYYSKKLKYDRLSNLGIKKKQIHQFNHEIKSSKFDNFIFSKIDILDKKKLNSIFKKYKFDVVCNLAAQAGVRYSLEKPKKYISNNIVGFHNIAFICNKFNVNHFIYASSSSVYGNNSNTPFSEDDTLEKPESLYAATKRSNELIAESYNKLYELNITGLRFFTAYGPWGRPDMAYYLFSNAISKGKEIKVFNNGQLERDFTYIDDIVDGIINIILKSKLNNKHRIYNIGNNKTIKLLDFIKEIEKNLNKKAKKKYLPMQSGDVFKTYADITKIKSDFKFRPNTTIKDGIKKFVDWYIKYNNK